MSTKEMNNQKSVGAVAKAIAGLTGLIAVIVAMIGAPGMETADAGEYRVKLCDASVGSDSQISRTRLNSGVIEYRDNCGSGGRIDTRVIASRSGSAGDGAGSSVMWDAPAGTSISGLEFKGDLKDHLYWVPRVIVSGADKWEYRPTWNPTPGERTYGFDTALNDGLGFSALPNTGFQTATLKHFCNPTSNNVDRCSQVNVDSRASVRNLQFDLRDHVGPEVAMSSSLFGEVTYGERKAVTLNYSDQGSGIYQRTIKVNGKELADQASYLSHAGSCALRGNIATRMSPCPASPERSDRVTLDTWDDDVFRIGSNTVETTGVDYSGNQTVVTDEIIVRPAPVTVDDPGSVLNGNEAPELAGTVLGGNGSGAEVTVMALDSSSGKWTAVGQAVAGDNGRYRALGRGLQNVNPTAVSTKSKKKCRKKAKGKRRCRTTKTTTSTYQIRSVVTDAPKVWSGGVSEQKEVVVRTTR